VVLSKKALAVLEQVKLRSEALGLPITRDSWVFANPRTGQPYTSLHIAFFKARDSAGLSSVRMPALLRFLPMVQMLRGRAGASKPRQPGQQSTIRTRFLAMSLDHETAEMQLPCP